MKSYPKLCKTGLCVAVAGALVWAALPDSNAKTDHVQELRERQKQVQSVANNALGAVVALTDQTLRGAGSGVIVSSDGLIMTASHVLDALDDSFVVTLSDGTEVNAKKLGAHRTFDAALAKITDEGTYPFMPVAKSVDIGEWCIAMGHHGGPEADRTPPVRLGKILSKGRKSGFLTSDCLLSGGDSGGPLFNLDGEVVGIHSSISPNPYENRHAPVTAFNDGWERMKGGENWGKLEASSIIEESYQWPARGNGAMLGVQLEGNAPVVRSILPGSAAEAAEIQPGDSIVSFDDLSIDSTLGLQRVVSERKPGDKVKVTVERDGNTLTLDVTLGGQS